VFFEKLKRKLANLPRVEIGQLLACIQVAFEMRIVAHVVFNEPLAAIPAKAALIGGVHAISPCRYAMYTAALENVKGENEKITSF
jgi:hypothetical protein